MVSAKMHVDDKKEIMKKKGWRVEDPKPALSNV